MKIPFLELKSSYLELKNEFDAGWQRVMNSGWYLLGEELAAFEQEFASYCGTRFCVGVGSGLDALRLCLAAWEIGEGDEVIVPAHTYIATWLAVSSVGAKPVPVEPDPITRNIDVCQIESRITPKTRAIIPVHLYGHPADMDPIQALAQKHSLLVLEDAAQSHGALYRGRRCGSLGDAAAFSFYPAKTWGPSAMAARSSLMMKNWRIRCACSETTAHVSVTKMSVRVPTVALMSYKQHVCG